MLMMLAVVVVLLAVNAEYLQDSTPKAVVLVVLSKVYVVLLSDWMAGMPLVLVALVGELLLHDHRRLTHLKHLES
jgi:multidrug efflux pump subunit AcrB